MIEVKGTGTAVEQLLVERADTGLSRSPIDQGGDWNHALSGREWPSPPLS